MLLRSIVAISLYAIFLCDYGGSTRIFFSKCDTGGFVCKTITRNGTNTLAVSLTCPTEDVTLYVHQFHSPSNIESLEITNCQNVTISLKCFDKRVFFQTLSIKNVSFLKIDNQPYTSLPPKIVYLENINYIENIPSFTFTQTEKGHSCKEVGKEEFRQIFLRNLTIDTIQSNAFRIPHKCENFSIQNVRVNRIQTSAIFVKLEKGAEFTVESSEFEIVEHLAFQITGMSVEFKDNKFVDVAASGINGTIESFTFIWNIVNTLQSYAISILCTHTKIIHNKFEYLKSGAFEKISPGLLEEANKSFGKLKFIYEFKFNSIKYMDAGSLHPDYIAYENVATDMILKKNSVLCSCYNIGWIFPGNSHGHISQYLDTFYELYLDKDSENVCLSVCNFPLFQAMEIFKQGKCPESDTPDLICMKTTNAIPTAPMPKTHGKEMTASARLSKKNSSVFEKPSSLLLLFTIIYVFTL